MKNDLTTKEGRIKALNIIEMDCIKRLRQAGVETSPFVKIRINDYCAVISICIDKIDSGEITIYNSLPSILNNKKESTINFGTSGEFNPTNLFSYWRTIHAASILKNWETACKIVNESCQKFINLEKEIEQLIQNKL